MIKSLVILLLAISLLLPSWQPLAAQIDGWGPAFQLQTAPANLQEQTERINQIFNECDQLMRSSRFDELANKAEETIKLSQMLGDKGRLARALNYLGAAHFYRGRMKEALELFKQVAIVAGEVGDQLRQANALSNAGNVLRNLSQFQEAIDLFNRSLAVHRQIGARLNEATVLRNIGLLYTDLGDYDRAEPYIQEALRLTRQLKQRALEQASLMSLAILEKRRARYQTSLKYFEQALALDKEANDLGLRGELLNNMAEVYGRLGDYEKQMKLYNESLELARKVGASYLEALVIGNIGEVQMNLGQHSEALDSLTRALVLMRRLGDLPEKEWGIDLSIARTQRALGRNDEALQSYRAAIAKIERLRENAVPIESSKATVIATRRDPFAEAVELLCTLKREAEALEVAETYRARAFLDLLVESRIDIREDLSEEQRKREDDLLKQISTIQKELWKENLSPEHEQQLKAELAAAENTLEVFRVELRRTTPRYAGLKYAKTLGVEQIQRELLDTDTALIEYLLGEKQSFAWVVSQKRVTVALLPSRKEIEERTTPYRQTLIEKASTLTLRQALARFHHQSRDLYKLLVQPLEGAIGPNKKLIIVPDGALSYLPFETLSSGSASQEQYLLERFAISYAPSASALTSIGSKTRGPSGAQPKLLLAFGDPVYSQAATSARATTRGSNERPGERSTEEATPLGSYSERGPDLISLPHTRAEVTGISSLYPRQQSQAYLGRDAREEVVKAERLDQYRYIHFAAHALIDESFPARSGIVLSLDDSSKEDGILRMIEIMRLKLNADMVTLSACSTGLGKLLSGEGMIGLTRAFFYAGASSVAVSLWNVDDRATAELMKSFYNNLNRGLSKDEALRQAKLALMRGQQRIWSHPYFWAPFVLIGE